MKKLISKFHLFITLVVMMMCFTTTVFATDLDNLNGQNQSNTTTQQNDSHNGSVTDYLQSYKPVTDENMANASQYASPITNILGTLVGFIIMLVSAGIFVITALDLAYIGLPFTRNWLNPQGVQSGASSMGGGMMGGGMMGGMPQQQSPQAKRWVSDEAVACVALTSSAQPQGGGMMSGGMMGGGMMGGGMMNSSQPQQNTSTKSVILMYLKKRIFFLVVFAVATILLTSSIFTDCGLNLAELMFKIMDKFNMLVGGVNI